MAGTFFKWLIPGVVTIVGGTILAIAQTGAAVTDDLGVRSRAALDPTELSWATVTVDGRDVVLSGTATTQASIDDAISRIGAVRGVRAVDSQVALAEFISPFPFAATLKDGKLTLTGAYPDELVHTALLSTAGEPVDQTRLYSGAPEGFESAAKFALSALSQLDEGEARLADLDLRITGRAKSTAAFDSLQTLPQSAPSGLHLAAMTITPPVAAPFKWTASFDGTKVTVSGDSPAVDLGDKLRALSPANVPVSTTLDLAAGAPPGFADNTLILLSSLPSLERGDASIEDGDITLSGAPATSAVADEVRAAITKIGGTVTLEPPRVADYATSIDKSAGSLVFGGFVPDAATRDRLGALPGADVGKLQLGRGETERFASALVFGLGVLDHLGEGRFGIKGDRISVGGRAATIADFKSATGLLAEGAPQGLSLAAAVIHPPLASPFT